MSLVGVDVADSNLVVCVTFSNPKKVRKKTRSVIGYHFGLEENRIADAIKVASVGFQT